MWSMEGRCHAMPALIDTVSVGGRLLPGSDYGPLEYNDNRLLGIR